MAREKVEAGMAALCAKRGLKGKGNSSRADRFCPSAQPIVLGADTVVKLGSNLLGKPRNEEEAIDQLLCLSGRTHQVLTAVAIISKKLNWRLSISTVTFKTLSLAEAHAYWVTGEPTNKAGSYAIQGQGAIFVTRLQGSYSGVAGLPLAETATLRRSAEVEIIRQAETQG